MAERLPIYEIERPLVAKLRETRRLIVSAPTGSGKSTQVPQMLLDHGLLGAGQVVILQPRRLAARLLAARVAWERNCKLGCDVGYQIRFENVTSTDTRIRFVTEGLLLRQMIQDPRLRGVAALIFDEFHERHLYGDVTLARALDLQETERPDLKILVMSATLDTARLEHYMEPCQLLESQGRTYPVEIEYAVKPAYLDKRPVWEQAAATFVDFVRSGGPGDVLVFMPGSFEIAQTIEAIRRCNEARDFRLLPLHGELSAHDQDAAIARYEQRKVVVATNVAETSLTIDGIRCVIDSGLARIPRYDPYRGINTLLVDKISRAAADQRAGRAGRTSPGTCLRLWSREEHSHRVAQELPEIKRLDLAEVVLTLKAAGIENLRSFRWFDTPEPQALAHAEVILTDLGALKSTHHKLSLTPIGRKMLAFPLHPRYARMLLAAQHYGCVWQACLLAALTQGRDLLLRNVDSETIRHREDLVGENSASDFLLLMRVWRHTYASDFRPETCRQLGVHAATARQVGPLFEQFLEIARREGLDTTQRQVSNTALHKCILIGFSDRVARRLDSGTLRCELVHGRRGTLARESMVRQNQLFVAAEVREVGGNDKGVQTLLSLATAIEEEWLRELFPDDLSAAQRVYYDANTRRVLAEEQVRFRDLAIGTRRVESPPADAAAGLLTDEVLAGRLILKDWDETVEQWILRLNLLSQWCPELTLPHIGQEERRHLVEQVCHGSFTGKDLKDKPIKSIVHSWLTSAQQALVVKHAPERLALSNGRPAKVVYEPGKLPHIALRIQQLFGVNTTPLIAMGRVPVLLHILAPNNRPVQITQDLRGFWREHYPKIKQELRRKYPKHEWR
ncbi:MAG TPA: ATP-dependent helicase HrpB [Candidatus Paceibacterota bacterium]|nr:ATP-dependent helicase HrpB [Verrucomicrobiota bacterium]HSA11486.1 ATP-dependent helicase HrpB [Candidatus Paceibacterota bacterium]